MKLPETVFQEWLAESISFNIGSSRTDQFDRVTFARIMRGFLRRTEIFESIRLGGEAEYPLPETTWEDIVASKKAFLAAMSGKGHPPEVAALVLKKVFAPVFAARFEDHREIMSFLYRLTQDAELLDRLIRA